MEQNVAHLRHQAELCRRLALGVNDDKTITDLLAIAQEYDEKAERFERNAARRRPLPPVHRMPFAPVPPAP